MAKRLIGTTRIELTDVRTGKTETIEKNNMVTARLQKLFNTNPFGIVNVNSLTPIGHQLLGGIALFSEAQTENVNNDLLFDTFTGYAQDNVNTTTDLDRGSLNMTETGPIHGEAPGYKWVWEWNTSQGNGTIAAVALTHPTISHDLSLSLPFKNASISNNAIAGYKLGSNANANYAETDEYNRYTWCAHGYDAKNGKFYKAEISEDGMTLKIHETTRYAYKMPLAQTNRLSAEAAAYGYMSKNHVEHVINLTTKISGTYESNGTNSVYCRAENGIMYMYIFTVYHRGNSVIVTKINLSDFTFTQQTLTVSGADFFVRDPNNASGTYHSGGMSNNILPLLGRYVYVYAYDGNNNNTKKIYKINLDNAADATMLSTDGTFYTIQTQMKNYAGVTVENDFGSAFYLMCNNNSIYNFAIVDGVLKSYRTRQADMPVFYITNAFAFRMLDDTFMMMDYFPVGTWTAATEMTSVLFYYTRYMATINNLPESVVKTADKTMKITYILREVDA